LHQQENKFNVLEWKTLSKYYNILESYKQSTNKTIETRNKKG